MIDLNLHLSFWTFNLGLGLISLTSAIFLQNTIRNLFKKYGVVSKPDPRRRHVGIKTLSGGVAITLSCIISWLFWYGLSPDQASQFANKNWPLYLPFFGLSVLGLIDDLKNISPKIKMIFQIAAASVFLFSPMTEAIRATWHPLISIGFFVFAFIWMVGISNAVNFIDGVDGLAGSIILMSILSIGTQYYLNSNGDIPAVEVRFLIAAIAPALIGFLIFNWQPSKVFMGDSGSLTLGFLLAGLVISGPIHGEWHGNWRDPLSTIFLLGYPVLDLFWVTIRRLMRGFSPLNADRSHLHHRILRMGFSHQGTVFFLLGVHLFFQMGAVLISSGSEVSAAITLGMASLFCVMMMSVVLVVNQWKVRQLSKTTSGVQVSRPQFTLKNDHHTFFIDIRPMIEEQNLSDKGLVGQIISSLILLIESSVYDDHQYDVEVTNQIIALRVTKDPTKFFNPDAFKRVLEIKVNNFLNLMNISISEKNLRVSETSEKASGQKTAA